jgi:hypothetical protein
LLPNWGASHADTAKRIGNIALHNNVICAGSAKSYFRWSAGSDRFGSPCAAALIDRLAFRRKLRPFSASTTEGEHS